MLKNKVVVTTGGVGLIGKEFVREISIDIDEEIDCKFVSFLMKENRCLI